MSSAVHSQSISPDADPTRAIIGAAIEVHKVLGPGFVESIYENALCIEMKARGIAFTKQEVVPIEYKGVEVGEHRLDLLVEDRVVVELKAVSRLDGRHFAQTRSYVQALGLDVGLLLNFGAKKLEIKRLIHTPPLNR